MNNLAAFFYIAMQRGMAREGAEDALSLILDWLGDVQDKNEFLYLPAFTIGYFFFERGWKAKALKEAYRSLGLDAARDERFCATLSGQICYLMRMPAAEGAEAVGRYIGWLRKGCLELS